MSQEEHNEHIEAMVLNLINDQVAYNINYIGTDNLNMAVDSLVKKIIEKKRHLVAAKLAHKQKISELL